MKKRLKSRLEKSLFFDFVKITIANKKNLINELEKLVSANEMTMVDCTTDILLCTGNTIATY